MKKILTGLIFLTVGLAWAEADDPTTLQVAPSDQVKYPDPAELLNKTDPVQPTPAPETDVATTPTGVPSTRPLLAAKPITVRPAASGATKSAAGQWFLKWTIAGDEDGSLSWAQALNRGASVHKVKDGLWEVWAGPFDATQIGEALAGQAGVATLVKR